MGRQCLREVTRRSLGSCESDRQYSGRDGEAGEKGGSIWLCTIRHVDI